MPLFQNVDWLRLKYRVLSFLTPACWVSLFPYNKAWDDELWQLLLDGEIKFVDDYRALIGNHKVWIANHPYASGHKYETLTSSKQDVTCSRATALFLGHELKTARLLTRLKYSKEEIKLFFVMRRPQE